MRLKLITAAGSRPGYDRCAGSNGYTPPQLIGAGHAFVRNLRRGHYELGGDAEPHLRLAAAFTELTQAI